MFDKWITNMHRLHGGLLHIRAVKADACQRTVPQDNSTLERYIFEKYATFLAKQTKYWVGVQDKWNVWEAS